MRIVLLGSLIAFQLLHVTGWSQVSQPGLEGKAPSKWITVKYTHAPSRSYQYLNDPAKRYTQEDLYIRMWVPIVNKPKFTLVAGPHYRTEQLEFRSSGENPIQPLDHWQLRSLGVDIKSFVSLTDNSWLLLGGHINQSVNLEKVASTDVPLNYSFTSVYLQKKSSRKEIGYGLLVNQSRKLTVLPIFIFNYNFSERSGLEMSLPQKISWRNNLSSVDILYVKAEASTRMYYINGMSEKNDVFRRIDVDLGLAYNRQITNLVGVEFFGGYRKNLTCQMPEGVSSVRSSGFVGSVELYIKAPKSFSFRKRK